MRRYLTAACLIVVLSANAFAVSGPAEKTATDTRLDRKVTIKAVGKPLGDFLKEVTAQTGVKMTARKDAADIKVAVFVEDTPLSSLRDALKDCLHLQCTREGRNEEWTYSFWEDLKTEQEAEQLKQEEIKKLRAFVDKLIKQVADIEAEGKDPAALAKRFGALYPEQQEKALRENPDRYTALLPLVRQHGTLPAITAYSGLSRAQLQALWSGERVTIATSDMSANLRQKFEQALQSWTQHIQVESWGFLGSNVADPQETETVVFSIVESQWNNKPSLHYMFGNSGSSLSVALDAKTDIPQQNISSEPDSRPDLKLKDVHTSTCYQLMEQAHDLTGVCVVSDYYTRLDQKSILPNITSGKFRPFKTGEDVLRQVAVDTECDLITADGIWLNSRWTWPSDRDREIPERLLARWRKARKDYGGARIQEALEMADLSKLQLGDLDMYKCGYGQSILAGGHMALRTAASLNAAQWQAAMTEQGLSTAGMSNGQLALIQAWAKASEEYGSSTELSDELRDPQRLRSCLFRIKYKGPGGKDDVQGQWEVELYTPSYFEAIRTAASKAGSYGEAVFAIPAPQCRGYIRLADLNQERGWPTPEENPDQSQ